MVPPLNVEIVTRWIEDGTAEKTVERKRAEAAARQRIAAQALAGFSYQAHPNGLYVWLDVGAPWTSEQFTHEARRAGEAPLLGGDTTQRYLDEAVVWGTPEEVADTLLALQETMHLHYLLAAPLSHESFLLLTDEVMPRLQ